MTKNQKSNNTTGGGSVRGDGSSSRRSIPTHFLCFPIASDSTIDQLTKSIAQFRAVSTEPARQLPAKQMRKMSERDNENSSTVEGTKGEPASPEVQSLRIDAEENDPLGKVSASAIGNQSFAERLKVLPSIVHRSPGTYHLTLGVMNLAESAEMQNAIDLLNSLDLKQLLRDAANGPPAGSKAARRWDVATHEQGSIEDETANVIESKHADSDHYRSQEVQSSQHEPSTTAKSALTSLSRSVSPPPTTTKSNTLSLNLEPQPLYISLTSLDTFPSAKRARVIWAKPHAQASPSDSLSASAQLTFDTTEHDRFYNFALHLSQVFKSAGLITETRPLVLHATVANMRYKVQAKGGRTTKGKAWARGRKRWDDGCVDVRGLVEVFRDFGGDVDAADAAGVGNRRQGKEVHADEGSVEEEDRKGIGEEERAEENYKVDDRDKGPEDPDKAFVWCQNVMVDRVAICKMGATKAQDPLWGEWYPPVAERMIFDA